MEDKIFKVTSISNYIKIFYNKINSSKFSLLIIFALFFNMSSSYAYITLARYNENNETVIEVVDDFDGIEFNFVDNDNDNVNGHDNDSNNASKKELEFNKDETETENENEFYKDDFNESELRVNFESENKNNEQKNKNLNNVLNNELEQSFEAENKQINNNIIRPNPELLQKFYKAPTSDKFKQIILSWGNGEVIAASDYSYNLIFVFVMMVLDKYPHFADEIIKNFNLSSPIVKNLLANALLSSSKKNEVLALVRKYNFAINENCPYTVPNIKKLKIKVPHHIDLCWSAYFAQGEKAFIEKILRYINEDELLLFMAYEIRKRMELVDAKNALIKKDQFHENFSNFKNSENSENSENFEDTEDPENFTNSKNFEDYEKIDLADIFEQIEKRYPNNFEKVIEHMFTLDIAIWSLTSLRKQDPIIEKKYRSIINENPSLDYWGRINKI